ncbi:MAG: hypothetical protein ACXWT1_09380 [Methylobacter sp.]
MTSEAQVPSQVSIFLVTYNHEIYIRQVLDALFVKVTFMVNIVDYLTPVLGTASALIPTKLKQFAGRVLHRGAV